MKARFAACLLLAVGLVASAPALAQPVDDPAANAEAKNAAGSPPERLRMAVDRYRELGFEVPPSQLVVDVRKAGVFFHNYAYADGDRFVVVLVENELGAGDFILCHEAFHYVQSSYLDPGGLDGDVRRWLSEPTAYAMAAECSGEKVPMERPAFGGDVFESLEVATFFWRYLQKRDPSIVRESLEWLAGSSPDERKFLAWLERRQARSLEEIVSSFGAVYSSPALHD